MPNYHKAQHLVGHPVGISFTNGQGASGVLCGYDHHKIYVMEYLYHTQFATKQYPFSQIQDILPFPSCHPHDHQQHLLY